MSSLGLLFEAQGKLEQAEQLLTEVLHLRTQALGEDHSTTLASVNNLAELYRRQGRQAESESLFTTLVEARRRVLGPDHVNTTHALAALGGIKLETGKYGEAEALLQEALEAYKKTKTEHWRRFYTESELGASLTGLRKYSEAETLLISGYTGIERRLDSIPADNRAVLYQVREWIAGFYRATGQPKKADEWMAHSMSGSVGHRP